MGRVIAFRAWLLGWVMFLAPRGISLLDLIDVTDAVDEFVANHVPHPHL